MKIPNLSDVKTKNDLVQLVSKMVWDDNVYDVDNEYDVDNDDYIYETVEEMTARSMLEYSMNDSVDDYSRIEVIAYLSWIYEWLPE